MTMQNNQTDQQMVIYNPSSSNVSRQTRSQAEIHQRAAEGDLQARLNLMSLQMVESELKDRRRHNQLGCSMLDFLQNPGGNLTKAQAAAEVLNELADKTEHISFDTALVWRYVELNTLWNTHMNPDLRSADAFLNSLDQNALVRINIVVGTSTDSAKRGSLAIIDGHWGPGWFEKIPDAIRPTCQRPDACPKRLLYQIAANCKKGHTLEEAIAGWQTSIYCRTDEEQRRQLRIRSPRTPYLITEDVASLNQTLRDEDQGRRTSEMYFPELEEDRLELMPTRLAPNLSKPALVYPQDSHTRKRKRPRKTKQVVHSNDNRADDSHKGDGDRMVSNDGKWAIKKVRNHLIREPAEHAETEEIIPDGSQASPQTVPPSAQPRDNVTLVISSDSGSEVDVDSDSDGDDNKDDQPMSCEGSRIIDRVAQEFQWSQDSRPCCKKCKTNITAAHYAIAQAIRAIQATHT